MGNNVRVAIQGIDTCKLVLRGGRTLLLHDVLYALQICRNLILVLVMLRLGFNMYLAKNNIELSLGTTHYGSGYVLNGFCFVLISMPNSISKRRNHSCPAL